MLFRSPLPVSPGVLGLDAPPSVTRVVVLGIDDTLLRGSDVFWVISSRKARASAASLSLTGAPAPGAVRDPALGGRDFAEVVEGAGAGAGGAVNESKSSRSARASLDLDIGTKTIQGFVVTRAGPQS